jgi:hypothetical protein
VASGHGAHGRARNLSRKRGGPATGIQRIVTGGGPAPGPGALGQVRSGQVPALKGPWQPGCNRLYTRGNLSFKLASCCHRDGHSVWRCGKLPTGASRSCVPRLVCLAGPASSELRVAAAARAHRLSPRSLSAVLSLVLLVLPHSLAGWHSDSTRRSSGVVCTGGRVGRLGGAASSLGLCLWRAYPPRELRSRRAAPCLSTGNGSRKPRNGTAQHTETQGKM